LACLPLYARSCVPSPLQPTMQQARPVLWRARPCARPLTCLLWFRAVRLLREELQVLQEPGSYVGEVIKVRAVLRAQKRYMRRPKTWAGARARAGARV